MKVVIANYRYFVAGGPERYMFNFMKEAKARNIECIPFSVDYAKNVETKYSKYFVSPRGSRDDIYFKNVKLTPRNILKLVQCTIYNFEAYRKMRKLLRDEKPDVLYILQEINSLSPSIIRAAKKENVRVVHRVSDFFMFCPKMDFLDDESICEVCKTGNYRKAIKKRCVKNSLLATLIRVFAMICYDKLCVFGEVDHFITTCQFTKDILVSGGVPEDKITCVNTFTELDKVVPVFNSLGYGLCLGRLTKQKGFKYAVEAISHLKEIDCKLKITGELDDSEEANEIRKIINDNCIQDKVEFVGFKTGEELEKLIQNALFIVNPAIWYENFPNTVIEAYAHGKPVIASKNGSLIEMIDDGKTGFLFENKNSVDLSKKMKVFFENPEEAYKMGVNARTIAEKKYSSDIHMSKVINILKNK